MAITLPFTGLEDMRETLAAALEAAAWILEDTWPSSTSNSHKPIIACGSLMHKIHLHTWIDVYRGLITLGLNKLPKADFFSGFFSSGFGAGGSSGLAAASRVLVLEASTWSVRERNKMVLLWPKKKLRDKKKVKKAKEKLVRFTWSERWETDHIKIHMNI